MTKKTIPVLSKVLSETFVLYFNTHASHWNVTGPHFAALHELFGSQYLEMHAAVDELAERLRALEAPAPSGLGDVLSASKIKDGTGKGKAEALIKALLAGHEAIIETIKKGITVSAEEEDKGTEDMLITRLEAHQKMAWMLRALTE